MTPRVVTPDEAIEQLGLPLLRELRAIRWFCDTAPDGKMALIPSRRRRTYEPGGEMHPLVATGCLRLYASTFCQIHGRRMAAVSMRQFGRNVLERAYGMGLRAALEADDDEAGEAA